MTAGALLLGTAILIIVALFLLRPFIKPTSNEAGMDDLQRLQAVKAAQLDEIRALDFDHETGKIPEGVYLQQREAGVAQAAETLRRLDEWTGAPGDARVAEIEAAVTRLRASRVADDRPQTACSNCGRPLDAADRFCAQCGQSVEFSSTQTTIPT